MDGTSTTARATTTTTTPTTAGDARKHLAALVRLRTEMELLPAWDVTVSIRGVEVPVRHPHRCDDATLAVVPPSADRWPGAIVWLWRWAFGAPRTPRQPRSDIERLALVRFCEAFLAPEHHALLEPLGDGELMTISTTFLGCQGAWNDAVRTAVEREMEAALEGVKTRLGEPRHQGEGHHRGEGEDPVLASLGEMYIRPGACLPAFMGGGEWGARKTARERAAAMAATEARA